MSHPRPHDDCHRRMDTLLTAVQTGTDRARDAEKALYVIRNRPDNLEQERCPKCTYEIATRPETERTNR